MAKEGPKKRGNPGHNWNDNASAIIERLSSYGVPLSCISDFLCWANKEGISDIGNQGYSEDTLQRHYRDSIDRGKVPSKEMLMGRMYAMAMMERLPEGVSPDKAYQVAADKLEKLLNIQHGIIPTQAMRHSGHDGGTIKTEQVNADAEQFLSRIADLASRKRKDQAS